MKHSSSAILCLLLAAPAMSACGATAPSEELENARSVMTEVEGGYASEYAPDELHEAKKLLARAEEADNGSSQQAHLAYLADRQARLARSSGTIEHFEERQAQAQTEYIDKMEAKRAEAQEQLDETQRELQRVSEKMDEQDADVERLRERREELENKRQHLEEQLSAKEAALTKSEKARKKAEERAKAAMASLEQLSNVKQEQNEMVITLSGAVLFETGKAKLLPIAENKLDEVASALKDLPEAQTVVVEGHTDSRGTKQMNEELSQKRADSVMDYLVSQGVEQQRLKAVGKGESDPIANNDTPEGRANNRRVELRIKNSDQNQKTASK